MLSRKELIIVGMVFINVINPPAATAPAPIWRMYAKYKALAGLAKVFDIGSQFPLPPVAVMSDKYPNPTNCSATCSNGTNVESKGMIAHQASTEPATRTPPIFGPIIYPTPRYSGVISPFTVAEGQNLFT